MEQHEDKPMAVRRITVGERIVYKSYQGNAHYAKISLVGKWVRDCGFDNGDKLAVKVYANKIVIEKESTEELNNELLERVQMENTTALKKKLKQLLSPQIYDRLRFEGAKVVHMEPYTNTDQSSV